MYFGTVSINFLLLFKLSLKFVLKKKENFSIQVIADSISIFLLF